MNALAVNELNNNFNVNTMSNYHLPMRLRGGADNKNAEIANADNENAENLSESATISNPPTYDSASPPISSAPTYDSASPPRYERSNLESQAVDALREMYQIEGLRVHMNPLLEGRSVLRGVITQAEPESSIRDYFVAFRRYLRRHLGAVFIGKKESIYK